MGYNNRKYQISKYFRPYLNSSAGQAEASKKLKKIAIKEVPKLIKYKSESTPAQLIA